MEEELKSLCSLVFWLKLLFPMITVFIAMYWAQSIFNRNARKRENRERRLKHIEECLILSMEIYDTIIKIDSCSPDDYQKLVVKTSTILLTLSSSNELFNLEISQQLESIVDALDTSFDNRRSRTKGKGPFSDLTKEERTQLLNAQEALKDTLRQAYSDIENTK